MLKNRIIIEIHNQDEPDEPVVVTRAESIDENGNVSKSEEVEWITCLLVDNKKVDKGGVLTGSRALTIVLVTCNPEAGKIDLKRILDTAIEQVIETTQEFKCKICPDEDTCRLPKMVGKIMIDSDEPPLDKPECWN